MKNLLLFLLTLPVFALPNPAAKWLFTEGSGTTVANTGSASGLSATLTGSPTWSASAGRFGPGLTFNGTTQYGTVTAATAINDLPSSDFSVCAWVNPSDTAARQLIGKNSSGAIGWYAWTSAGNGDPRMDIHFPGGTTASAQTEPNTLRAGTTSHLCYAWSNSTRRIKIHVNGVEAGYVANVAGSGTYSSDASYNLAIGIATTPVGVSPFAKAWAGTISDLRIYTAALTRGQAAQAMMLVPSTGTPVVVRRVSSSQFSARVLVGGTAPDGEFAEYDLKLLTNGSSAWAVQGLRVARFDQSQLPYEMSDSDSVWEFAWQMGATGSASGTYDYVGFGHGKVARTSWTLALDSVDMTSLAVGDWRGGSSLVNTQGWNTLLPADGVTQTGTATSTHTWASSGMTIAHTHSVSSGYSVIIGYAAMFPITSNRAPLIYGQVSGNARYAFTYPSSDLYDFGGQVSSGSFTGTLPYTLTLSLPSGGPDTGGDWSNAQGTEKFFLRDSRDYSKFYVCYISGTYNQRKQGPFTSSHSALYAVTRN